MSNKPEKYLPGRPCRDCEQTEPNVVGGVLMEPNGNSTIRQIVENVMMSLGANNHDFRLRDKLIMENAHYIQRHSDALSASLDAEIDQAEADEAFREVIRELCSQYGMAPDDKPYFYLKRKLAQRDKPDLRLIIELAKVCADHGIQEGEDPATFLESKCREVDRLTEELESTQHKLADAVSDAESDYDQDDCVQECMVDDKCNLIVRDIHVNTLKCVAHMLDVIQAEHKSTRELIRTEYLKSRRLPIC